MTSYLQIDSSSNQVLENRPPNSDFAKRTNTTFYRNVIGH